ncbi:DNA helicase-2 / ATP-dependent DNA helicase PcrA [Paenibacillus sp. 1_12]|uniref:UvrD-helicase domain-containing protein n=1 Tax=Paenibacillus sp. 1_12 TaxID=1566278 RepID=UPI0008E9E428|nr:ATP-dependent helicase [Paenibacillus sp. 1_12]SFM20932.1 DNA helicase-2 / ATP-dependent DNA helicase PcrA [Paenibacillus sp. 1_12]
MFNPTPQQVEILKSNTNSVIVAGPGSGKTTTLANKINQVLKDLRWYQGVIAISYTNKASDELKRKTLLITDDVKNSSFSTIDSFCISNILLPFGKHFFGVPNQKITVDKSRFDSETVQEIHYFLGQLVDKYTKNSLNELESKAIYPIEEIRKRDLELISKHYQKGYFDLRLLGHISYLIYISSRSCRQYFQSRYTNVFIDEFQDSGLEQYLLFIRLAETGLISWAIGDVNQSIFGFAQKSSDYLLYLMQNPNFVNFPMTVNHRCHPSIDFYGQKLLNFNVDYSGENRVFEVCDNGNEISLGNWLNTELNYIKGLFDVSHNCEIGVLAKSERTLELFSQELNAPYKLHLKTPIDNDQTLWGGLFRDLIKFSFNDISIFDIIDNYLDRELPQFQIKAAHLKQLIIKLKKMIACYNVSEKSLLDDICEIFTEVALLLYPESKNAESVKNVRKVFEVDRYLNTFSQTDKSQLQLMTLHKSKGLEFDVVIHLDLYQFIIPGYDWIVKQIQKEFHESRNLHYVGVTRARKALFLATSSNRFIARTEIFDTAKPSEFLGANGIDKYRLNWNEYKLTKM